MSDTEHAPAERKRPTRVPGQAPASPVEAKPVDDGLPNAIDVDPHTIKSPTLTRQGWVVPAPKV